MAMYSSNPRTIPGMAVANVLMSPNRWTSGSTCVMRSIRADARLDKLGAGKLLFEQRLQLCIEWRKAFPEGIASSCRNEPSQPRPR